MAGAPSWYRPCIAVLFAAMLAIALANAARFPPSGGYDAVDHYAYADDIIHGRIPSKVGGSEYYSPPGFYAIAGSLTWVGGKLGLGEPHRLVLAFNVLVLAATALLMLAAARELWPGRHVLHVAALGYLAFLPVTIKLTAMFHPEPLDLLAVTAALYLAARGLRRGFGTREAVALGVVLGLALLVRQFALYGVGAVLLALAAARYWRTLAIVIAATAIVAGPWYVRQAVKYSSPTGFGETSNAAHKPLLERRPASFYLGTGLPDVFTAPWRPHYLNRAVPTTYTELWGDYFGIWDWKTTPAKTDLRIQSVVGVLPTLLAVGGWLLLLWRRSWLVALVPLLGFLGYAYFTIAYPTADGDVLKASYMLTTATAWALCFGYAVDRLAQRRAVGLALAAVLAVSAVLELPFLFY